MDKLGPPFVASMQRSGIEEFAARIFPFRLSCIKLNASESKNQQTAMVNYRRHFTPGGSYFFTVALHNRHASHLIDSIDLLRTAFRKTQTQKPFQIDAIVVLPEHLHCIWTLPDQDSDYPARWQLIKSVFSHELEKSGVPVIRRNDGSYLIWQRRYWEHTIRNDSDMQRHIDYIHFNPVKHGLVKQAGDWPYSSLHRYIRMGWLPENWAGVQLDDLDCGE